MSAPSLDLKEIREAVVAIRDGYPALFDGVAFLSVRNPRFRQDDGSAPYLVINVPALVDRITELEGERDGYLAQHDRDSETLRAYAQERDDWKRRALLAETVANAERARITELEAEVARLRKWTAFRTEFLANPTEMEGEVERWKQGWRETWDKLEAGTLHELKCSANPSGPLGEPGCSCTVGRVIKRERYRANAAEARLATAEGLLREARDSRATDYADAAHPGWPRRVDDFLANPKESP